MPRFPRIFSESPVPSTLPTQELPFGSPVGQALVGAGEVLQKVTDPILAVEEEKRKHAEADDALMRWSTLSTALGDMETELKQGARDDQGNVIRPPATWDTYRKQYEQGAAKLSQEAITGAQANPNVQRLLQNLYTRWRVEAIPGASVHANKLFMDSQAAALTTVLPQQAERLAQIYEQEPTRFKDEKALIEAWIAGKANVFGEQKTAEALQKFGHDVAWNIARRGLDGDPNFDWRPVAKDMTAKQITSMQEHQERRKREAEAAEKKREAQAEANFREVQKVIQGQDEAAANYGTLSQERIEQIAAGKDEFYPDPGKGRELQRINENPPFGAGNKTAADTIMAQYATGERTLPRIERARAALNHALSLSDRQEPAIIKALETLQGHEQSAKSAARGERQTVAAEKNANIAAAVRDVEGNRKARPGFLPAMIRQADENKHKADIAEARMRAGKGEDPKKVAEDIKKRNEQKAANIPPTHRKVQELPE